MAPRSAACGEPVLTETWESLSTRSRFFAFSASTQFHAGRPSHSQPLPLCDGVHFRPTDFEGEAAEIASVTETASATDTDLGESTPADLETDLEAAKKAKVQDRIDFDAMKSLV